MQHNNWVCVLYVIITPNQQQFQTILDRTTWTRVPAIRPFKKKHYSSIYILAIMIYSFSSFIHS